MQKRRMDFFSKLEELPAKLYVILAIFMMVVHITVCAYTNVNEAVAGVLILAIYVVVSLAVHFITRRKIKLFKMEAESSEKHNNGVIYTFQNNLLLPYAVVTKEGKVVTSNTAFSNILNTAETVFNRNIADICNTSVNELLKLSVSSSDVYDNLHTDFDAKEISEKKETVVEIHDKKYRVECHSIYVKNECFYMILFHDVTEYLALDALHYAEHTAVAYIVLDNLEGIAQYAQADYQVEANRVGDILKEWVKGLGGVIREHERNKYIMICNRKALNHCTGTKFDILDEVRNVHIGEDNIPVTISMGISTVGETLAQREKEAAIALDMALQRGGDQVVLKNQMGTFYFGGRTKSLQKRSTGGLSRTIATKLSAMISASTNVIVMGHSNPDFDSIGACVGIAVLVKHLGGNVKIVTDTSSENFKACTGRLCELADYKTMFTDGVSALDEVSFGTLVIVVDANNFSILEAPEIVKNSFKIAVIDHHIKKEEYEVEPALQYIDPSASSACELVSEILEHTLPTGENALRSEEANVMMAGIMVDTKNFTRTVGSRTFAAALFLRNSGASTEYARTFFEQAFEDYLSEAQFGIGTKIYRDNIAITSIEGSGAPGERIAAAKAADKLLAVKNVHAAFALIKIGETVFISARSDGSINVQLILEKIGGGGHFDVAGAALAGSAIPDAVGILTDAIDRHFADLEN